MTAEPTLPSPESASDESSQSSPDASTQAQSTRPAQVDPSAKPTPEMKRYKLTIAYDGTNYHGWQKQKPPGAPKPIRTVAGVLESTMIRVLGQPLNLVGASRTDAGVYALGQVAQFDAATRIPIERLAEAINSRLPHDIEVRKAEIAPPDFQAIGGAKSKQYRYRIFNSTRRPLWIRNMVWHCWWDLDVGRMAEAAKRFIGTHDFAGFTSANHGRLTTVRTVFDCRIETAGDEVHLVISGSGFLYNMVRIITGTVVEVGRGRFDPDVVDRVLESCDRRMAGNTMPPEGLCLEWIRYDEATSQPPVE